MQPCATRRRDMIGRETKKMIVPHLNSALVRGHHATKIILRCRCRDYLNARHHIRDVAASYNPASPRSLSSTLSGTLAGTLCGTVLNDLLDQSEP